MKGSAPFHYGAKPQTKDFAKKLRQGSTYAEDLFWQMVRNRKVCNLKIRRQHPIGPFIADFYCHELLLVIEVDGSIHELEEIKQKDLSRENYLKDNGLKVLRFSNDDVMLNSHIIEEKIKEFIDLSKKT
ncbi:MAG: hypothetical protein K0S33_3940 [Bacteroidetes bacterium]|jgi:cyclase|nr:hypothetical protein [Bacteroidota bacterium]